MDKNINQRVSVKQAAKELGVSPQSLREFMRRGIWSDIGDYIPAKSKGKRTDGFIIYRPLLDKHIRGQSE